MEPPVHLHQHGELSCTPPFDPAKRYVRVTKVRTDGFVEFAFAVGDPELAVDLILPVEAYREFCRDNQAVLIAAPPAVCTPSCPPSQGDAHVG
jgi:phenol hydroxylase P0 protein